MWRFRRADPIGLTDIHECDIICMPWDLDPWMELNNGRTLTLYDIGRIPMVLRNGMLPVLREKGWGFTVAGSTVRYRKRVTVFQRLRMTSRIICWDDRFIYMEQAMWNAAGDCTSHLMLRTAIVSQGRMVPMAEAVEAAGYTDAAPPMPDWVAAWVEADAKRPWPPMQDG